MASVLSAAQSNDRVAALRALRDRLAADLDKAPPTVSAQLAAQLRATLADLAAIVPAERTEVDELASRRKVRRA